jgi:hypothetical protein
VEKENSTIYCLRADNQQGISRRPIGEEEEKREVGPIKAIWCRFCGSEVTGTDQKIAVHGSHTHTFFNPTGIVFELGCFSAAPGCRKAGEATSEFTWFAGHVWRIALCRRCNSHLGWFFEKGDQSFYGLILTKIRE